MLSVCHRRALSPSSPIPSMKFHSSVVGPTATSDSLLALQRLAYACSYMRSMGRKSLSCALRIKMGSSSSIPSTRLTSLSFFGSLTLPISAELLLELSGRRQFQSLQGVDDLGLQHNARGLRCDPDLLAGRRIAAHASLGRLL